MVRVCPAGSEVSAPHAPVATTSPAEHEPPCRKPGAGGLDLGCNVALYRPGRPDPASPVRTVPLRSGNDGVVQLDRLTFCCLSQNPALKASHNRPPMQAPVSKSGSADMCVGGERFWEILASSGQVGQIGHFSGGFWDEPFPQPRLGEAGFRFLVDSPLDRSAAGAPYLSAA